VVVGEVPREARDDLLVVRDAAGLEPPDEALGDEDLRDGVVLTVAACRDRLRREPLGVREPTREERQTGPRDERAPAQDGDARGVGELREPFALALGHGGVSGLQEVVDAEPPRAPFGLRPPPLPRERERLVREGLPLRQAGRAEQREVPADQRGGERGGLADATRPGDGLGAEASAAPALAREEKRGRQGGEEVNTHRMVDLADRRESTLEQLDDRRIRGEEGAAGEGVARRGRAEAHGVAEIAREPRRTQEELRCAYAVARSLQGLAVGEEETDASRRIVAGEPESGQRAVELCRGLVVGELAHGVATGALRVVGRLRRLAERHGEEEVVREGRERRLRALLEAPLDGEGDAAMRRHARGREKSRVEGLAHERMREAEPARRRELLHQAGGEAGCELPQDVLGRGLGRRLQDRDRELATDHRRELEEVLVLPRQRIDPAPDRLPDSLGESDPRHRLRPALELAGLAQHDDELVEEERVSLGGLVQACDHRRGRRRGAVD
jgi:hypothetical protein